MFKMIRLAAIIVILTLCFMLRPVPARVSVIPAAVGDDYATNEDAPLTESAPGVLSNDADEDGDILTAVLVNGPAHGTLTLNPDGSFTYTPAPDYSGADGFIYLAYDGVVGSDLVAVSLTVNPVNDAPAAADRSASTDEDTPLGVTLAGTDPDGDAVSFEVLSGPAHGTLSGAAPNLVYTPAANYHGPDSFTFKANDGVTDSNAATVAVTVTPVNDAPAAAADNYATDEDLPLTVAGPGVLANDAELDHSPVTAIKLTNPVNGTLTFATNGSFTYKPAKDFNGADSFTYKASDGLLQSEVITVTVTVAPVNDIPVVSNKAFSLREDGSKAMTLTGTDIDGDALTFTVVTSPEHGVVDGASPNFVYTPGPNYHGPDSFDYVANDGLSDSLTRTVTLTVNPANDAPVAAAQSATTREDTPKEVTLEATDIDGDALAYAVVAPPAHGTLSGAPPHLTYTPALDYSGPDSFTFKAYDGVVYSNVATVSVAVNPGNDAPAAADKAAATFRNLAKPITLEATDSDGDALLYSVVAPPEHGTLSGVVPSLVYTPADGYTGPDSFTFKASDGALESNVATVAITVHSPDNFPVANADGYTVNEDTNLSVTAALGVLANDTSAPGSTKTAIKVTGPANATTAFTFNGNGSFTYRPKTNFNGTDSFTYKISDGTVESAPATVTITVRPVNDAPVAAAQSIIVTKDSPSIINPVATDVDGDALTYEVVTPPAQGSLTGTAPDLSYSPADGFTGADSFTFKATDSAGAQSGVATVSITVNAVDPDITSVDDRYTVKNPSQIVAASKGLLLNDTDALGRAKTAVLVGKPSHGAVTVKSDGGFTYIPAPGYYGLDSFTYRARAGGGLSNLATVELAVEYEALTKVNLPIVATVASYATGEYVEVSGTVKYDASTVWNYQTKQFNDLACLPPTPGWYHTDYNKTSFIGTAVGLSSGHAYDFKISSSKHDLCTPFPPFDWHRIINVVLTDKVTKAAFNTAFLHQVHPRADGFTDVPPILDGNFVQKQSQTTPQLAYVTNPGANTVTVADIKNRKTLKTIAVGSGPDGVAVTPTAAHVYVANSGSDAVSVIDRLTNTVVATIPVGDEPRRVVIDPLGLRAYVTNRASNSISVIDTASMTVVDTIDAADGFAGLSPVGLAVNNVGTQLFVANTGSNTISVINTATGATVTEIVTPGAPGELAVRQDGSRLAASMPDAAGVLIVNTADHTTLALVAVGLNPAGLEFAAPGDTLYVANTGSNTISVINAATNSVETTITAAVGNAPTGVDVSDHGLQLVVANAGSNTVSDILIQNTSNVVTVSNRVRASIGAGAGASKVALLF
jgi:YVTN family beta-propeller protein